MLGDDEPVTVRLAVDAGTAAGALARFGDDATSTPRDDGETEVVLTITNRAAFRSFVLDLVEHAEVLGRPKMSAPTSCSGSKPDRQPAMSPRPLASSEIQRILALVPWIVAHPGATKRRDRGPVRDHRRPTRRRPRPRPDDRRPAVLTRRLSRRRRRRRPRHDPSRRSVPPAVAAHSRRRPRAARGRPRAARRARLGPERSARDRARPSSKPRSISPTSWSRSARRASSTPCATQRRTTSGSRSTTGRRVATS